MSSEWQMLSIGEIGKVVTGKTPSTAIDHYYGGEYPFYTPSDMDGRKRLESTKRTLSNEGIDSIRGSIIEAGAVMVSCIGSDMGKVAIAANKGATNQQINTILVSKGFDPEYIYYELSTRKDELQMLATGGSAQPILNKGHFCQIEICVPPLKEQKAIAHILGTLDDKVELNRKINETLEAMAKALFKSWFVDFDPVRAKAEGRPTGLPDEISDLFPEAFEDSELGEIPSGWEVAKIDQIVNLKKDAVDPFLAPDEVFDHYSIPAFDAGKNPSKELGSSIKSQKLLVDNDDLLVSKLNPSTPRVWIPFPSSKRRSICSTEFLVCQASTDVGRAFAYCLASSDSIIEVMTGLAGGTSNSHQRIRPGDFLALDCCMGSPKVRSAFSDVVEPLLRKTLSQRIESRSLASTRDALLPKLISGEIRIPDAERMIEEVGV